MAIDRESGNTKHVITQHNNWVSYSNGRGGLHAYTFCGWLYVGDQMEGAYIYGDWWQNPDVPDVCPHCVHTATCKAEKAEGELLAEHGECAGCDAFRMDAALGHPHKRKEKTSCSSGA